MNEAVKKLMFLQDLDSRIIEKSAFVEKVPLRISEVDGPLKAAEQELQRMTQRAEALAAKKKEKEKLLEELADKIKKMKARASEIKTNKEYQAHLKEIEASEKEIEKIEEDILGVMLEMDGASKVRRERESVVKAEMDKINAFKKELDRETDEYRKELAGLKDERTELSRSIDQDLYNLYMRLLRDGGGVAVTAAKNEICLGCNMNIPPQLFVEIRKNEEIIQCPQCRRILYYPDESPQNGS